MRFFCCCQSDQRTLCQNCAAGGFGNPPQANASCPPGVSCGTASTGFTTYTTCLAPLGHPCCATYSFTAAGYIYPRWCKDDGTGACVAGSLADRNVVSYSRTRCDSNPPCVNPVVEQTCMPYRSIDSVPWSITVNAPSYQPPGNPGFCDIDAKVMGNLPVSTTTISGDWRTVVTVTSGWSCRGISLTVTASWAVKACYSVFGGGGTPVNECGWFGCGDATLQANYVLSPGSGTCNIDGTYILVTTSPPSFTNLVERHLDEIIPPTDAAGCPDCYELGGPMRCGYLPSHPFGWRLDQDSMLAGLPTAIQVIKT